MENHSLTSRVMCYRCGKAIKDDGCIRLWDARWYHNRCIEAHYPALLKYAENHSVLEESLTFDRREYLWHMLKVFAIVYGLFACLVIVVGLANLDLGEMFVALLGLLGVFAVAALIQIPAFMLGAMEDLPTVRVVNGKVTMFRASQKRRLAKRGNINLPVIPNYSISLECISWFQGRRKDDSHLKTSWPSKAPATILAFPVRFGDVELMKYRIACGHTEEMRKIWGAFLTLARVPYRER